MNYHDTISSYIDNELSVESEQEFLIALAANDGLRKTFRSELVLKQVIHRDEVLAAPPRSMRAAVFAAVGLGVAATAADSHTAAASQTGMGAMKSFLATKVGALVTAAGVVGSGLAGYGVHSIMSTPSTPVSPAVTIERPVSSPAPATNVVEPAKSEETVAPAVTKSISHKANRHFTHAKPVFPTAPANSEVSGVSGTGTVEASTPIVNRPK